jgi:hypothetical protein
MSSVLRVAAAVALAVLVQACAPGGTDGAKLAPGEKLQITQEVWDDYQQYVRRGTELGPDRNGAFGVAIIGDVGVAGLSTYTYCPRDYDGCRPGGTNALTDVLDYCRRENVECIIFARNDSILVPYEIVK